MMKDLQEAFRLASNIAVPAKSRRPIIRGIPSNTQNDDGDLTSRALEAAVTLLTTTVGRSKSRHHQQYMLRIRSRVAPMAACFAIHTEKPAHSIIELLETCRGILVGFSIDCRSDISHL